MPSNDERSGEVVNATAMPSGAITVFVAICAFAVGLLIGRSRDPMVASDCSDAEAQLRGAESLIESYKQQEQEWFAADAAFLEGNTYFPADADKIIDAIRNAYATKAPYYGEHVARLSTNIGAEIEFGTNKEVTTSATVRFLERNREHGLAIVRIVASHLVGAGDSTKEVVDFASFRPGTGVVLIRFHAGIVGISTRDEGNYSKRITVTFTPTRSK